MKCVSVYTNNFELFSELFESIIEQPLQENEEKVIEGITVNESGVVPDQYVERMKSRPEVVVMKDPDRNITILQHGELFEILLPDETSDLLVSEQPVVSS